MKVVRVTISLPAELVERARAVDINISHACRAGLEARLAGETEAALSGSPSRGAGAACA
jgi:post-segregation antitoxin (ccd killing protein)